MDVSKIQIFTTVIHKSIQQPCVKWKVQCLFLSIKNKWKRKLKLLSFKAQEMSLKA